MKVIFDKLIQDEIDVNGPLKQNTKPKYCDGVALHCKQTYRKVWTNHLYGPVGPPKFLRQSCLF